MFAWKLFAIGLVLFSLVSIPTLLRAALYPFWPPVDARIVSNFRVPHTRTSENGTTEDASYQRVRVEYEAGGRTYVEEVPNGTALRDAQEGHCLPIRVCPWRPRMIWHDDGKEQVLRYVLGLAFWTGVVVIPVPIAFAVWDGR